MPTPKYGRTVTQPNVGLVFDRPPIAIPEKGLRDGNNFRVKNGVLESRNMGWERFAPTVILNGAVGLIDNFFPRNLGEKLIFGTATDLYLFDPGPETVTYLNARYNTGTASASGTAVTGVGTSWTANVRANDQIHFGDANQNSTSATWYTIQSVNSNTSITLTASAGTIANGVYTIRKRYADTTVTHWAVDTFLNDGTTGDDLWFATNGIDPVVTWNGSDATVTNHPELGFICYTLSTYSNMMIYGNITQAGDNLLSTIINSDIGLPLNAGATGTGLSEQFVAHSNSDGIINLVPMGDYLIIYSERTIVPTQFVGDPLIFTFRVALSGVGPIGGDAIADFGDFHEFVASDAGYTFDGVALSETNSHVWREILRQADPNRRRESFAHFDEENGDLIWAIPSNSDPGAGEPGQPSTVAWNEHYLEVASDPTFDGTPFSKRDFLFTTTGFYQRNTGLTWDEITEQWQNFNFAWNDQFFQNAFPLNLAGGVDGTLWVLNQTQTGDGEPLPSFVRTGRWPLTTGRERDLLTRVYPFVQRQPYNIEVGLYMGDFLSAEPDAKGTQNYDQTQVETQNHFVTFYRRGRVMELTFGSSLGEPWALEGWTYDKIDGGKR